MRLCTARAERAFAILGRVREDAAPRVLQARELAPLWVCCPEIPRREELRFCIAAAMCTRTDELETISWRRRQRIDGGMRGASLHVHIY